MVAVDLSHGARPVLGDLPPLGGHLGAVGKAIPQQNGQLAGGEADTGHGGGGPPLEAAPGEAFVAQSRMQVLRVQRRVLCASRTHSIPSAVNSSRAWASDTTVLADGSCCASMR